MIEKVKSSDVFLQDTLIKPNISSDTTAIIKTDTIIPIVQPINRQFKPKASVEVVLSDQKNELRNHQFFKINNNDNTLINNYNETILFDSNNDSCCYIVNVQNVNSKKVILSGKSEVSTTIEKQYEIKERPIKGFDWTVIPVFLGMFLLASIVSIYRKHLGLLFESFLYRFTTNKNFNDKNIKFQRLTLILDFLFIISFALVVDRIIKGLGLYSPPEKYQSIIFLTFCLLLIVLKLFRIIVFKLSALVTNHQPFFKDLFNGTSLYTRTLGIFLLPMVFLISYSTGTINLAFIYLSIFVIFIMLIFRFVSMFRAFMAGGFSIFYFILYLCALEIIPLLAIWKEVNSR